MKMLSGLNANMFRAILHYILLGLGGECREWRIGIGSLGLIGRWIGWDLALITLLVIGIICIRVFIVTKALEGW